MLVNLQMPHCHTSDLCGDHPNDIPMSCQTLSYDVLHVHVWSQTGDLNNWIINLRN